MRKSWACVITLLVSALSCGGEQDDPEGLGWLISESGVPGGWSPSWSVEADTVDSRTVEGLRFVAMRLSDPTIMDGGRWAAAGALFLGRAAPLESPEALQSLVGPESMQAAQESDLEQLCYEIARFANPHVLEGTLPEIFPPGLSVGRFADSIGATLPQDQPVAPPQVRVTDAGRSVDLWSAETNRTVLYRCVRSTGHLGLNVVAEFPGSGLVTP